MSKNIELKIETKKNLKREIKVTDMRDLSCSFETVEKTEEWLKIEIPNWCDEVEFKDEYLIMSNSFGKHLSVKYQDVYGSWGSPTILR